MLGGVQGRTRDEASQLVVLQREVGQALQRLRKARRACHVETRLWHHCTSNMTTRTKARRACRAETVQDTFVAPLYQQHDNTNNKEKNKNRAMAFLSALIVVVVIDRNTSATLDALYCTTTL